MSILDYVYTGSGSLDKNKLTLHSWQCFPYFYLYASKYCLGFTVA